MNKNSGKKQQSKFYCNPQKTIDAYAYEQQPLTADHIRIPPQGWKPPTQHENFETDDEMADRIRECPPKFEVEQKQAEKKKKTTTCRCIVM